MNGTVTEFLYDELNPVQELSSGTPSANLLTGLGLDETYARVGSAPGTPSLLSDALGSTLALADSLGTLLTEYTYEPFGATTTSGTPSANAAQFTGRENDGAGLYYYRARYYHPVLGRFISEDPIQFAGGDVNLYGYVSNGPINATDPLGLAKIVVPCGPLPPPLGGRKAPPWPGIRWVTCDADFAPPVIIGGVAGGGRGGLGKVPGFGKQGIKSVTKNIKEIAKKLGIDRHRAQRAVEQVKRGTGRGGKNNVVFDGEGNIIDPRTGEIIGHLGN